MPPPPATSTGYPTLDPAPRAARVAHDLDLLSGKANP
jgi:hypothetical protein